MKVAQCLQVLGGEGISKIGGTCSSYKAWTRGELQELFAR